MMCDSLVHLGTPICGQLVALVTTPATRELLILFSNHCFDSLPNIVVSAESVNSFKSRLDKFWSLHDFVFDYRASPLDTGSYI